MKKREIEQIFRMVCSAFPRSNAAITRQSGEIVMKQENITGLKAGYTDPVQEHAGIFSWGSSEYYRIVTPLSSYDWLHLYLCAADYSGIGEPTRMLETLISLSDTSHRKTGQRLPFTMEENPLLGSLLYADTMEMRIYTVLLAEERGKNLELPRVVCVIRGQAGRLPELMDLILRYRKTGDQDICGVVGGESIILCRCLKEPEKSVRYQCGEYLSELYRRIEEKCGFSPEIWVGTQAQRIEEYRCSMEAAVTAGECARIGRHGRQIVYAIDYILEYTVLHTDHDELKHFLEPYAEKLRQEPELLSTAEVLIDYNMNVSLAARQRYMHRNTMMLHAAHLKSSLSMDPVHNERDRCLLMMACLYCRKYA